MRSWSRSIDAILVSAVALAVTLVTLAEPVHYVAMRGFGLVLSLCAVVLSVLALRGSSATHRVFPLLATVIAAIVSIHNAALVL